MNLIFLCKGPSIEMIYFLMLCMVASFCLGCYSFHRLFNSTFYSTIKDGIWYERIIYTFCFFAAGVLSAVVSFVSLVAILIGLVVLFQ